MHLTETMKTSVNRTLSLMLAIFAISHSASAEAIDDGFRNPPRRCALQTWWHWIDDCVTREGISRDLKAMADAGISTAFVFSPKTWTMQPMVETMSPAWLDLFAFAIAEAKRNGIELGFHNCPGWSSSGGPWIKPEDSMKSLVSSSLDIRLGDLSGRKSLALPPPPQKLGFYGDVRLYAFPVKLPPRLVSGEAPLVLPLKKKDEVECVFEYAEAFAPSVAAIDLAAVDFCMGVDVYADEGGKWIRRGGKEFKLYRSQDLPRVVPVGGAVPSKRWKFAFRHVDNPAWIPRRDLSVRSIALGDWPYEGARTSLNCGDIVDLGNAVSNGAVSVDAVQGRLSGRNCETWRLVRAGYTTTATPPAPATIAGLECDKLDRKGLAKHWRNMPARILSLPGARDVVKYVAIDSYEVGKQTWTESLPDEFLRRTGREIWPALPALLGYRVDFGDGVDAAAEVDRTIADLYAENYYDYFAELCHAAGVKSVTEPYGGPFDSLRCGKLTDVPTCEFWIGKPLSYSVARAVSIARTHGKNIVAAESFTTNAREGRWQATPQELRLVGDNAWMAGVNQFVYHSYVHQPYVERVPGCTLGPHGTQLNVNTTWWPMMRVWSDYVARGQFLLQYGHIVRDRHDIVPGKIEALVREGDGGERIWFVRNKSDAHVRETLALDCAVRRDVLEFDAVSGRIFFAETASAGVVAALAPGETRFYVFAKNVKGEPRAVPGELLADLSLGWKIAAFSGLAAPEAPVDADTLFDWSMSKDERLRHFSGSADYVREGDFPSGILDLGDVHDIAQVRVDGKLVGTIAYRPYRIAIPAGKRLDVKIVNTWPNRLIGDAIRRERGETPFTWCNWSKPWGADEKLLPAGLLGPVGVYRRDIDIRSFGAVGDGKTVNTSKIQSAIDDCSANGGGRVVIAGGTYVTGTIILKSGVELHVAEDGVLMGSSDWRDWKDHPDAKHIDTYMCPRHRSAALIFADEEENISITGAGTIHGNGMAFVEKDPDSKSGQLRRRYGLEKSPPRLVLFAGCRRVRVDGVRVLYPPAGWSFWVHDCDEAVFTRVKIFADVDFPNADGIHVNCSRDVKISDCDIETGDDCIIVRANSASLKENKPCERVSVDNCRLRSYSSAVRVGWTNDGVMRDCTFSNLKVRDSVCGIAFFFPAGGDREKLSDQGREASVVENMIFSDIEMSGICARPVYVEISPHETTNVERIRNIRFKNVSSRGLMLPVVSAPRPGIVSDIFFENCRFEIDPAGKSAYRNGGDVGFARVQRFEGREHGRNVENMKMSAAPFKDGDRVVFFGDSITHGGFYGEYMNLFYATRYPERSIWFSNSGWSGASAQNGLWSIEDDIVSKNPTVVTIMFGMNDVNRNLWPRTGDTPDLVTRRKAAIGTYDVRMDELVRRIRAEAGNPEIIYFTPSPYDQTCLVDGKPSDFVCNDGLAIIADHVRSWAKRDKATCVDLQARMLAINADMQAKDPSASILRISPTAFDRVHPGPLGHMVMLYEILKAQGAEGCVDEIDRDAKGADTFAFCCTEKSLPFPMTTEMRKVLALVPFEHDFNREILRIKNLKEGRYVVKIDGAEVGLWTADDLAAGVNLALNEKTPQCRQAAMAAKICAKLWTGERTMRDLVTSRRWMRRHYKADPDEPGAVEKLIGKLISQGMDENSYSVKKYRAYLKDWPRHAEIAAEIEKNRAALAEAVRPREHRFEIQQQ